MRKKRIIISAAVAVCVLVGVFFVVRFGVLGRIYDAVSEPIAEGEAESEEEVEEKEEAEEIIVPEETAEETPPVVEEKAPEKIEWEGVTISPIEGLKFDKGTFFAEAGNPYNLEVGEKAGVFVKDAVEINGVMESSIGLRPEVIEVIQKKIMEEDKEFRYAFPINLEQAKTDLGQDQVVKIGEGEIHEGDRNPEENRIFNKDTRLEISNVPLGAIIYAPSSASLSCALDEFKAFGGGTLFYINIIPDSFKGKEEIINDVKIDRSEIFIRFDPKGFEFVSPEIREEIAHIEELIQELLHEETKPSPYEPNKIELKMGMPLIKVIDKVNLKEEVWEEKPEEDPEHRWFQVGLKPTDFQIEMDYRVVGGDENNFKAGRRGLESLLEIGEMKVFILPAYD